MEIHFEIENNCLLECRHCSSRASRRGEEMKYSIEDIIAFLSNIKENKEVFLTGGEPLLYPNIDILLHRLNTEIPNITIGMFTTGIVQEEMGMESVSESRAHQLARNGLKVCYLSVYSHLREEHDWMTNYQHSFEKTKLSCMHLRQAGIKIRFNTVITARNQGALLELINMAEVWGVEEVRLLKLIRHGRACDDWDKIGITEKEYEQIVCGVLDNDYSLRITVSGAVCDTPCRFLYKELTCPAGRELWYVTYWGDIYPCASVKNQANYRVGNISESNIYEKCEMFRNDMEGYKLCL